MPAFDVVLFGATGVTGGNAVPYLVDRAAELGIRWAVAGRSPQKLHQRLAGLPFAGVPEVLEADLDDPDSLLAIARSAKVLINAVGPYRSSADPVIAACVEAGTHYLDLTGETDVVADMIERHHEAAVAAGVRIVQVAGYEALPFDLAVQLAVEDAHARGTRLVAADVVGSAQLPPGLPRPSDVVSGGTWASTVAALRGGEVGELLDPAALVPDPAQAEVVRSSSPLRLLPRLAGTQVVLPLLPSPFTNPAIVHRTQALLRDEGAPAAAPTLRYREGFSLAEGLLTLPAQLVVAGPIGVAATGFQVLGRLAPKPLRRAAATAMQVVGPDPGEGPDAERLEGWRWRMEVLGHGEDGEVRRVSVDADGHPGYLATSRMVAEAALLLADDDATLPGRAGHLTPALALGTAELARFARAGLRFRTA